MLAVKGIACSRCFHELSSQALRTIFGRHGGWHASAPAEGQYATRHLDRERASDPPWGRCSDRPEKSVGIHRLCLASPVGPRGASWRRRAPNMRTVLFGGWARDAPHTRGVSLIGLALAPAFFFEPVWRSQTGAYVLRPLCAAHGHAWRAPHNFAGSSIGGPGSSTSLSRRVSLVEFSLGYPGECGFARFASACLQHMVY